MNRSLAVRLSLLAVVVGVSAALAVPALAAPSTYKSHVAARGTTVRVITTEFHFALSTHTVKAGPVTFAIVNKGKLPHDLKIAGKKSKLVPPGKSTSLTVTLKKGRYPYLCTVPGHAAAGMKGVLVVK